MSDHERAELMALRLEVGDLRRQLTALQAFVLGLSRRQQLHEAGLALYEMSTDRGRMN